MYVAAQSHVRLARSLHKPKPFPCAWYCFDEVLADSFFRVSFLQLTFFPNCTTLRLCRQLRRQRATLAEEKKGTEKKLRLLRQQVSLMEAQQSAAADAEDFDMADRLAAILEKHLQEQEKHQTILSEIQRALGELDKQQEGVVKGVTECFKDIRVALCSFEKEQKSAGKQEDTEVSASHIVIVVLAFFTW